MISCWVLSSSSRPAGQARAAGERRQAHGHRRASQRHSPGSRGRKQDEAGCDEGQGCRRRQQQLPRQILKVFRSFQAAGDAPPVTLAARHILFDHANVWQSPRQLCSHRRCLISSSSELLQRHYRYSDSRPQQQAARNYQPAIPDTDCDCDWWLSHSS